MNWLKKNWPLVVVVLLVVAAVYIYHLHELLKVQEAQQTYERQLRGQLDENERKMQALNVELNTARAQIVPQDELEKRYKAQLDERDKAFEQFRKDHDLQVKSYSDALYALEQTVKGGKTTVVVHDAPQPGSCPVPGTQPAHDQTEYTYEDPDKRVNLYDPDIFTPDNEVLKLHQNFRLNVTVAEQRKGYLQTQRAVLTEVAPQPDGGYKELGEAKLVDAKYTYTPIQSPPPPKDKGLDMSVMASVGSTFASENPLVFGGAVNVVRYKTWGLAAGLVSDFASRAGTSPDAFVTYRPRVAGRYMNLMIGAGAAFPLGGSSRVVPTANVDFVIW
jgi:hypothetical protein